MEFVIAKKDFDSAVRQILFGRPASSTERVDLTADGSIMKLEAMGTSVEVPVEVESPGTVRLLVSEIAGLKRVSATYKIESIRIRVDGTHIRFHTTSINLKRPEEESTPRTIDIPNDASAMDLLSLPEIFSAQEIADAGLRPKVLEAKETKAKTMEATASSLHKYDFTLSELSAMAETKLKAHTAIMRRVLFPDPPVSSEDQDREAEANNDEETTVKGKQMSESQMRAELERLRTENAQLKNKDRGGISLKVSEKGAISLYGMGRFPVTLYKEQWLRVLGSAAEIEKFIQDNEPKLKTKD